MSETSRGGNEIKTKEAATKFSREGGSEERKRIIETMAETLNQRRDFEHDGIDISFQQLTDGSETGFRLSTSEDVYINEIMAKYANKVIAVLLNQGLDASFVSGKKTGDPVDKEEYFAWTYEVFNQNPDRNKKQNLAYGLETSDKRVEHVRFSETGAKEVVYLKAKLNEKDKERILSRDMLSKHQVDIKLSDGKRYVYGSTWDGDSYHDHEEYAYEIPANISTKDLQKGRDRKSPWSLKESPGKDFILLERDVVSGENIYVKKDALIELPKNEEHHEMSDVGRDILDEQEWESVLARTMSSNRELVLTNDGEFTLTCFEKPSAQLVDQDLGFMIDLYK